MVYTPASEVNFLLAHPKVLTEEEILERGIHKEEDLEEKDLAEEDLEEGQPTVYHPTRDVSEKLGDSMVNTGTPLEAVQVDCREKSAVVVHLQVVRLKRRTAYPVGILSSLPIDRDFALNQFANSFAQE